MSFLKKTGQFLKKANELTDTSKWGKPKDPLVTAENLVLGKEIATDMPGLTLTPAKGGVKVDLDIVGESFRQENIRAIQKITQDKFFDIYLVAEPTNQYDENAVGVWAGGVQVGYIGKEQAKKLSKRARAALKQEQIITGMARCVSSTGEIWGVFGYAYLDD